MNTLDSLLDRNKQFAAKHTAPGALPASLPEALPKVRAIIIGCADMRVDPNEILGLGLGEAVVIRNIGGRVTPQLLEELGLLGRIGQVEKKVPGGGGEFHLIVLHHTDCGITRLTNDPALLSKYFQINADQLPAKSISDPRESVKVDIEVLRAVSALPATWIVSGWVYDTKTGRIEVVVPATPIRSV